MDMSAVGACERQSVLFSRPVAGFPLGFTARLLEGGEYCSFTAVRV